MTACWQLRYARAHCGAARAMFSTKHADAHVHRMSQSLSRRKLAPMGTCAIRVCVLVQLVSYGRVPVFAGFGDVHRDLLVPGGGLVKEVFGGKLCSCS